MGLNESFICVRLLEENSINMAHTNQQIDIDKYAALYDIETNEAVDETPFVNITMKGKFRDIFSKTSSNLYFSFFLINCTRR